MPASESFPIVFAKLRAILKPHAKTLTVTVDTADAYSLDGPFSEKWKRTLFFGSAQIKKNYVSFYLMPVYMFPQLLKNISPELKKRMQGKSCFNFKKVEPELLKELAALTKSGAARFKKEN
ncbi:MAG: hypothetical protein HFACDABA_02664 [Anaerolineales bacterium]|nr:hypothetical protein [Anaerolineales bacterium]